MSAASSSVAKRGEQRSESEFRGCPHIVRRTPRQVQGVRSSPCSPYRDSRGASVVRFELFFGMRQILEHAPEYWCPTVAGQRGGCTRCSLSHAAPLDRRPRPRVANGKDRQSLLDKRFPIGTEQNRSRGKIRARSRPRKVP